LHGIPYATRYEIDQELPRFKVPDSGVDPKAAYQLLHDELLLGELRSWAEVTGAKLTGQTVTPT
jgi:hypothetical protein